MTNLIDDIRRDREAGTPGPWVYDKYSSLKSPNGLAVSVWGLGISHSCRDADTEANARRFSRVPQMEDALLAAVSEIKRLHKEMERAADTFGEIGDLCWDKLDKDALKSACDEASMMASEGHDHARKALEAGQ